MDVALLTLLIIVVLQYTDHKMSTLKNVVCTHMWTLNFVTSAEWQSADALGPED